MSISMNGKLKEAYELRNDGMYIGGVNAEKLAQKYGTPLYVYDENVIRNRVSALRESITWDNKKLLYACKANNNFQIMKIIRDEGMGIDAVAPWEIELALKAGFEPKDILFTGNNVTNEEMEYAHKKGVLVNMDSLSQLRRYGSMFPGTEISIRINPEIGDGHHAKTVTGGEKSKFGIYHSNIGIALEEAETYSLKIIGLHQHIGSGIRDVQNYIYAMEVMFETAKKIKGLEFIDFGGGIGVPYKPEDTSLNIEEFGRQVSEKFEEFCREYGKDLRLVIEPGRFPVCESGILLARVNTIKKTPLLRFAGLDTGFNHLIRPAMYGSHHEIKNATRPFDQLETIVVAGNICESGDVFTLNPANGHEPLPRKIAKLQEGDLVAILNGGAYGYSMGMLCYNMRPMPTEVMIRDGIDRVIRNRMSFENVMTGQIIN